MGCEIWHLGDGVIHARDDKGEDVSITLPPGEHVTHVAAMVPAARLDFVMELLNAEDTDGNPCPLISRETALRLLRERPPAR